MKAKIISLTALTSIALFSTAALADGAHCDSLKGHGQKDMSAEAWKEFKDNHAWIFSHGSEDMGKSATAPDNTPAEPAAEKTSSDLVEI